MNKAKVRRVAFEAAMKTIGENLDRDEETLNKLARTAVEKAAYEEARDGFGRISAKDHRNAIHEAHAILKRCFNIPPTSGVEA